MSSIGYALARAELIQALTAYSGITTNDGAGDGTTLIDSNLIGRNDFITEKTILIMSGDAKDEDKGAASFDSDTGTITLQGTGFSAQIKAGTIYRVLNISTVEIDVANINTKIGTNVDPAGTTTIFAWLAKLFTQGGQGLVYYGKVTQVDDATHFRVAGLAGLGDAYFANTYRVYVVRDAGGAGAAPQGEMQPCSGYDSADGIFTHTAFTAGLAVDDEVLLLHERIAEIADLISRLGDPTGDTLASITAKWGDIARSLDLILGSRWDAAGDLGTDIAAIFADIGDASTSTLGSIYAILGNPAQSFLTMIGYEGATSLADKLTAARALLLDRLALLATGGAGELTPARAAALQRLIDDLTAARAGYLDELAAANIPADIDAIKGLVDTTEAVGSYTYLDGGLEQDVYEDTAVTRRRIWVCVSNRNMTQTGTFRIYRKVDGVNYDLYIKQAVTVGAGDERAFDAEFTTCQHWKITYQEDVDEGADRNIPYEVIVKEME